QRRINKPPLFSYSHSLRFTLSTYNQSPYSSSSSSSTAFASSSTTFASRSSTFLTGINLRSASPPPSAVCLSLDRSVSNRSISTVSPSRSRPQVVRKQPVPKKTCMCSPTTHPGLFRCSLYKNQNNGGGGHHSSPNNRLNARRSAMTSSLVRIGGMEGGDLVKRALAALIRPSSHQRRRRKAVQPRPSRLSVMSMAAES
ncbi:hypothetical protein LINGRAHAP2_LOCUS30756, partial [Linum grandiflorum]